MGTITINRINAEVEHVKTISMVDQPANEANIHTCGVDFCLTDEKEHNFTAPVLIPNQKIWRSKPEGRFVYFTKDGIERLAHRFITNANTRQLSLNHGLSLTEDITLIESFIAKTQTNDYPTGTWLVSIHVNTEQLWAELMDGKYNGVSIEMLAEEEVVMSFDDTDSKSDILKKGKMLDNTTREQIFGEFK